MSDERAISGPQTTPRRQNRAPMIDYGRLFVQALVACRVRQIRAKGQEQAEKQAGEAKAAPARRAGATK